MSTTRKAQLDPTMHKSLLVETFADAELSQEVDGTLLEHPRAHPLLDVLSRVHLEYDAVNSPELEQPGERQSRRPGAKYPDLSPYCFHAASCD